MDRGVFVIESLDIGSLSHWSLKVYTVFHNVE